MQEFSVNSPQIHSSLVAHIIVRIGYEVKAVLAAHSEVEVIFCCFSAGDKAVYESLLNLS